MPVYIKPNSVIIANLGIEPNGPVHKFFTNTCYNYMDKYVPYSGDTGRLHLRENVSMEPDKIIYHMPYARYQYYGVRSDGTHKVENHTTPGTGPYWDKLMVSAEMSDVMQEVKDYMRTHGGK